MKKEQFYDRTTQVLHWLLAAMILLLIFYHPSTEEGHHQSGFFAVSIHVTLGIVVLFLVLGRIFWRLRHAHIPPAPKSEKWQLQLRQFTHITLYLFMLLAPLMGIMVSLSTNLDVRLLGLFEIPQMITVESAHELLRSLHGFSADVLMYLGLLHIAAALYHQFWLKDNLLKRIIK